MIRKPYILWSAHRGTPKPVADVMLETDERGRYQRAALRYNADWLRQPDSIPAHPLHAPLTDNPQQWNEPFTAAFLDDLLPGHWERRVLARWRETQGDHRDPDDLHALYGLYFTENG